MCEGLLQLWPTARASRFPTPCMFVNNNDVGIAKPSKPLLAWLGPADFFVVMGDYFDRAWEGRPYPKEVVARTEKG